ncbi:hypothetical protein DCAR_0624250 [Daucus carota subsp. sativus]|uniref:SCP domain-containing protein n=1 Tax=Daucus carota subsp. sativus TaxID=79200 RepID=A0AAF1B4Z6_DAUCS|nr:PREDICTED: pathogenesis-related leaf protein 4-like [Daucus carota subsp. sativus]WOH04838.1 hypothetical protein DCAR_0624250 [Daucus carota subsp. sativus]
MENKYLYLLTFLTLATLSHHSHAQNSNQDFLNAHNTARSQVGVGPMVWDAVVAQYALNYTNSRIGDCGLVHSGGPYGENLAKGSGSFTGTAAVNLWVAEKADYNYATNTCASGKVCGHYTQVVWRNSVRLGCARVLCSNGVWWFITCSYDPPGNYIGQKPY